MIAAMTFVSVNFRPQKKRILALGYAGIVVRFLLYVLRDSRASPLRNSRDIVSQFVLRAGERGENRDELYREMERERERERHPVCVCQMLG